MNKLKRLLIIFFIMCLSLSATACNNVTNNNPQSTVEGTQTSALQSDIKAKNANDYKIDITDEFTLTSSVPDGFTVQGSVYTITKEGEYTLSGLLLDGKVIVNVADNEDVTLNLDNIYMVSANSPISVISANNVDLNVVDGSYNLVAKDYTNTTAETTDTLTEVEEDAGIYSVADLNICGSGALVVKGESSYEDAIHTKKDLIIEDVILYAIGGNNALKGNNSVEIKSGDIIAVSNNGDGIKTSDSDTTSKGKQCGNIDISGGTIEIYSKNDAIDSAYDVNISGSTQLLINTDTYANLSSTNTQSEQQVNLILSSDYVNSDYRYSVYCYNDDVNDGIWVDGYDYSEVNFNDFDFNSNGGGMQGAFNGEIGDMPDMSNMPQMPNGEMGDMPDMSDVPQKPNGEMGNMPDMSDMPQMPSGEMGNMPDMSDMPQMPNGEMPDMSDMTGGNFNFNFSFGDTQMYAIEFNIPTDYQNIIIYQFNQDSENSTTDYVAKSDGSSIDAQNYMISSIEGGTITGDFTDIVSDNGQNKPLYSAKGIKADNSINISNGRIIIYSTDDCIHANNNTVLENNADPLGDINISGGSISLTSGDDGIHSDNILNINGGKIEVITSYEGIEANIININAGEVLIYATDDAINVSSGNSTPCINVNGGYVEVQTPSGDTDAIDSNGNYVQNGGTVIVKGGSSMGTVAGSIDVEGSVTVTDGTVVALGGICETPTNNSCNTIVIRQSGGLSDNASFSSGEYSITDSSGNKIVEFTLNEEYSSLWISSAKFEIGQSYSIIKDNTSIFEWTQNSATQSS